MKIPKELELRWKVVKNKIIRWTSNYFKRNGFEKAVIGISGGIDSAVCAYILRNAIGKKLIGVLLPESGVTSSRDLSDSKLILKKLKIQAKSIEITKIVKLFLKCYPKVSRNLKAYGNLKPRIRMAILYAIANTENGIVVGTSDRSEYLLGYFTKWGDGAADIAPLLSLYKTQVIKLGELLKVPQEILQKPPSPNLWKGQTAEGELGMKYDVIDSIFFYKEDFPAIYHRSLSDNEIAAMIGVDVNTVKKVLEMKKASEHKRQPLPHPEISHEWYSRGR